MDLRDLESFLAVVDNGGFRSAADALYVSQPSLSRRVRNLEHEVGVRLLERGPWGVSLTGNGETLARHARRILVSVEDARVATAGAWQTKLRLGATATSAGRFLAPFLAQWLPKHPQLHIQMVQFDALDLRRRLADGQCDVAIVAGPVPAQFDHLPLTDVAVHAWMQTKDPLAADDAPLRPELLDRRDVLVSGRRFLSTQLLLAACRGVGAEPRIVYECSVGQTLTALVEAGLGIAILSDNVDLRGFDLKRRPVVDQGGHELAFSLHIAWLKERTLPQDVYEFARGLSAFTHPLRLRATADDPSRNSENSAQKVRPTLM